MKRITGEKKVKVDENAVDFQEIDVDFGKYLASNDETTLTGNQGTERNEKNANTKGKLKWFNNGYTL